MTYLTDYLNAPTSEPTQKSKPTTSSSYGSEVLSASPNEQKWTTGKNPKLKPGQMIFEKGNYYWVGSDNKVQKTANINTAYASSGFKAGEKAADVKEAANQNFNLKGGQVQYDQKSGTYYFKDPKSGKMLTTTDLSTAYGVINPKNNPFAPKDPVTGKPIVDPNVVSPSNPYGMHSRTETYASGTRPDSKGEQFYQPVYQGQSKNYAQPGYSLMGNQQGLGALSAVQGQNTQGTARTYGVDMGPVSQYTQYANTAPTGIGQTRNPFSINPQNYRQQGTGMGLPTQQPTQQGFSQGMQGGFGQTATPFGSGTMGGFGGMGSFGFK